MLTSRTNKVRLLLLTCGTNACCHIAKILKLEFGNKFYIVGLDINKPWLITTTQYLDKFYQSPLSSNKSYYDFVLKICEKEKIDFLLPSFDYDQSLFYKENDDLLSLGVHSLGVSNKLTFYRDKISTFSYLNGLKIPVPKAFQLEEIKEDEEYFVKPIHGVGSIDARQLRGKDIKLLEKTDNYIIQEICKEPEYTLECFNLHNKLFTITRQRIATKAGVCTKARILNSEQLNNYARLFISKTETPYIFNMQFMLTQNKRLVCTDLNLRAAGGMSLSYAAGWDEVSALGKLLLGYDDNVISESIKPLSEERFVVRTYQDIVTKKIRKNIAFDLDGTLLDSRLRHQKVMEYVLAKHNIRINCSDLVSYKTNGRNNLSWLKSKGFKKDLADVINKEWVSLIEDKSFLVYDHLYSYTIPLLEKYSKDNSLYLLTARNNKENVLKQIRSLCIEQYFDDVLVVPSNSLTSNIKASKLKQYDISEFIGDTESDFKASKLANCSFLACLNGFRSKEFLDKEIGDYKTLETYSYH